MLHPSRLPPPPGRIPPYVWRDGRKYLSIPEAADAWRISRQAVRKWALTHPDRCIQHNGHHYVPEKRS